MRSSILFSLLLGSLTLAMPNPDPQPNPVAIPAPNKVEAAKRQVHTEHPACQNCNQCCYICSNCPSEGGVESNWYVSRGASSMKYLLTFSSRTSCNVQCSISPGSYDPLTVTC
ncbi:hypothetical protein BT63DRAFT_422537 [Microthyrium microscopicum]|uniref:4Fe-4S ferredoxin-type domain-containing protein n=1 Tax=Microthyrium microscopicum TaxID=703497 RepID=A0A6A6UKN0_9PEZI|nr:hypothetical protein BT63DRAFT_422537 [Microthyrium microscopicum]